MFTVQLPTPRAKRRRTVSTSSFGVSFHPFSSVATSKCFVGILKPDSVEVNALQDDLYKIGFFGKKVSSQWQSEGGLGTNQQAETNQVEIVSKEMLVLSFEEAFFLCYALGCLVVKDGENMLNVEQLWQRLLQLSSSSDKDAVPFPALYAAYHHFRCKGWVVKPGIKFGAHFLLYKEGPPSYHATYSVRVLRGSNCSAAPTWMLLGSLYRATINSGKNVLLCYVLIPESLTDFSLPTCIKQFNIQEMLVNRWVAAAERSE